MKFWWSICRADSGLLEVRAWRRFGTDLHMSPPRLEATSFECARALLPKRGIKWHLTEHPGTRSEVEWWCPIDLAA